MGVMVSTAEALFSKAVSYWMTTYSPSGASGRVRAKLADLRVRDFKAPSGERALPAAFSQSAFVIAVLKRVEAPFQLSAYFPLSVMTSHALAEACALGTASDSAARAGKPTSMRIATSTG